MHTHPCQITTLTPVAQAIQFEQDKRAPSLEDILIDVCQAMEEPVELVVGKSRKTEHVVCRKIFFKVAKLKSGSSLQKMADVAGRTDHSTVISALKKVQDLEDTKDLQWLSDWTRYVENSKLFNRNEF